MLAVGDHADDVAEQVARNWGTTVTRAGQVFAERTALGEIVAPESLLAIGDVFTDLDVLFWEPAWHADVIGLMRQVARRRPAMFVWPGGIDNGSVKYGEVGRRDAYEAALDDALVIRGRADEYAGEEPFSIEMVRA